jgi:hypothetical protein
LSFVKQIPTKNKSDGIFSNYIGVQKLGKKLRSLNFDILRVPHLRKAKLWVLLSKFPCKTNLMALLETLLGSRIKKITQNFEIWRPKYVKECKHFEFLLPISGKLDFFFTRSAYNSTDSVKNKQICLEINKFARFSSVDFQADMLKNT